MSTLSSTTVSITGPTRQHRRADLVAGLSGLTATVLVFLASPPEAPAADPAGIRQWVQAETTALQLCGASMAVGAVLLLVLLSRLRARALDRSPAVRWIVDAGWAAGLLCAAWLLVAGSGYAVLALDGSGADDAQLVGLLGLGTLADTLGTLATPAKAALLICISISALVTRDLPRWLGWLGLALGVVTATSLVGLVGASLVAEITFHVGLFAFALWPGTVGVLLAVRAGRR